MPETQTEVGAKPAPEKANFPPFDATTFVPQLFWLAITFALLFVLLKRVALPRVASVMAARQEHIADDLNTAEELRKQAEASLKAYEQALAAARTQAAEIAAQARHRIKAETDKQRTAIDADLARKIEAAEAQIAEAKKTALAGVRALSADIAAAIVEKVLGERPAPAELGPAVDFRACGLRGSHE